MTGRSARGLATFATAIMLAASCADEPVAPIGAEHDREQEGASAFEALLSCSVDVSEGSMECGSSSAMSSGAHGGPQLNLIVGGQHQYVRLINNQPVVENDVFSVNVAVQNLTLQPFGTASRPTAHPDGVRIFFVDEPNNGVVVLNHDGTAGFLDSEPTSKYYQYSGQSLSGTGYLMEGEVSGSRDWRFELNGATVFEFSVLVNTTVRDASAYSTHLTRVVAGQGNTCGEDAGGNIYCWGWNPNSQLGVGTIDRSANIKSPVRVTSSLGVALSGVAVGWNHICAEGSDGHAYCWGAGGNGQLGNGRTISYGAPVRVTAPEGITLSGLTLGEYHTCAEGSDGNTYCWGYNEYGQVGDVTSTNHLLPVKVMAPDGVKLSGPAAGRNHTCAEGDNGRVYCWGRNFRGNLGDGSNVDRSLPVEVKLPDGVRLSGLASMASAEHTCARGSDGNAYCWGSNFFGQTGVGATTPTNVMAPSMVVAPSNAPLTRFTVGQNHTCAEYSDGDAYCWGENGRGQLGDGTTSQNRTTPVRVIAPSGVRLSGLSAGGSYTCAVSARRAYCWGSGESYKRGDGTNSNQRLPVGVGATR